MEKLHAANVKPIGYSTTTSNPASIVAIANRSRAGVPVAMSTWSDDPPDDAVSAGNQTRLAHQALAMK